MAGCSPVTHHGVTPTVFNCLKQKLESFGIKVPPGHSGTISGGGFTGSFNWDGSDALTITMTELPSWANCTWIFHVISQQLEACGDSS